jgi:hypothetical protein
MSNFRDRVIGALAKLLFGISNIFVQPAVQRIPVRNPFSISRGRR